MLTLGVDGLVLVEEVVPVLGPPHLVDGFFAAVPREIRVIIGRRGGAGGRVRGRGTGHRGGGWIRHGAKATSDGRKFRNAKVMDGRVYVTYIT